MKVVATEKGFYKRLIQAGTEFEMDVDPKKMPSWVKEVGSKQAKEAKAAVELKVNPTKDDPKTFAEMQKKQGAKSAKPVGKK